MTPPSPVPATTQVLALERRRWTALFALPFAIVVAVSGVRCVWWLPQLLGPRAGSILGWLVALAAVAMAASVGREAWRSLTEPGPALILDARGITDQFHLHAHLPWSAVQAVKLEHGDGASLVLVLRPGAVLPSGHVVRPSWRQQARRLVSGGDLTIPLGGLVYQPRRLRETLDAQLARARAARGVETAV